MKQADLTVSASVFLQPVISVDKSTKRIGLFNGVELVREFQSFTNEPEAIKEANEWFKTRTIHVPQVVFPIIRLKRVS